MTDSHHGMEGSGNRIHKLMRAVATTAVLAGMAVVAGCGGGGGDNATVPAPVKQASSAAGGVVSAEGTLGLVGPAGRATKKSQQFDDATGKISPKANERPGAHKKGGVGAGDACNDRTLEPSDANIAQLNAAILCLVNGERADNGLPALNHDTQLDQAATGMCGRMVGEHFFSHETPDGKTVVDRVEPTGYIPNSGDWVVGENLAWGSGALSTPQAIVNGWMNSPGHKANILAPDYKDLGLASCMGSPTTTNSGGTVYVNNFGAKSGADPDITLPGHTSTSGDTGGGDSSGTAATVAGTKAAASSTKRKRAACVRRASKIKHKKARLRAKQRCRRH
jgi:uncharacterized protein YkwD